MQTPTEQPPSPNPEAPPARRMRAERIDPKKVHLHLQTALRKLHRLTLLAEAACEAARTPAGPTYLTESELGIRLRGIHQDLTRAWSERKPRRSELAALPTRSF